MFFFLCCLFFFCRILQSSRGARSFTSRLANAKAHQPLETWRSTACNLIDGKTSCCARYMPFCVSVCVIQLFLLSVFSRSFFVCVASLILGERQFGVCRELIS